MMKLRLQTNEHDCPAYSSKQLTEVLCWASRSDGEPEQRERVELSVGTEIKVKSGRYRGQKGTVVGKRQGVVRVKMEGDEGAVEADVAAAHCLKL